MNSGIIFLAGMHCRINKILKLLPSSSTGRSKSKKEEGGEENNNTYHMKINSFVCFV